ncbi:hypothetical protein CDAR_71641 [Caerostris darwini]|uniref:Uncharacterized protein n=1 Tax=Caerostris darwini TaxID=1538125 RepID=A0AAV4NHU1_9ARAC|nr:hypothetical protein CDAR_71641 [Caerostris darwini]
MQEVGICVQIYRSHLQHSAIRCFWLHLPGFERDLPVNVFEIVPDILKTTFPEATSPTQIHSAAFPRKCSISSGRGTSEIGFRYIVRDFRFK